MIFNYPYFFLMNLNSIIFNIILCTKYVDINHCWWQGSKIHQIVDNDLSIFTQLNLMVLIAYAYFKI